MRLQRVRELRPLQAHSEDHGPIETNFLVIGAGIAGLRAAIELADAGHVLVLAKQEVTESATHYAQGGIAAVLSDEDEITSTCATHSMPVMACAASRQPRCWWKRAGTHRGTDRLGYAV